MSQTNKLQQAQMLLDGVLERLADGEPLGPRHTKALETARNRVAEVRTEMEKPPPKPGDPPAEKDDADGRPKPKEKRKFLGIDLD